VRPCAAFLPLKGMKTLIFTTRSARGHASGRSSLQLGYGLRCTPVGIVSAEPIRCAGLESAFENHASISAVAGDLDAVLMDSSLRYLILDLGTDSAWAGMQSRIRSARPDMRLMIVGPGGNDELILTSIGAGARGYLDSNSSPLAVRRAMETVIRGVIWAPRRLLTLLIDRSMKPDAVRMVPGAPNYSPRERQVLDLLMTACTYREIAAELGIEERTVKAYASSLMRKAGVDNRVSLSVQATQHSFREQRVLVS
jgi:DNA-binding NarL/FixJ family response regulator